MTEKVTIGNATLYCGDCRDILPTLPRFDLVLTDPPYGINQANGFDGFDGFGGFGKPIHRRQYDGDWDDTRPDESIIKAVVQSGTRTIMWGGQYFADLLPAMGKWLWWDKCQTMPTYGDGELAWTNLKGVAPKKFVYSNNGLMAKEKDREHPTQKPVSVMAWCLSHVPEPYSTVLDPFMGSGTTGVACAQMGKAFTGIERERKYFDVACRRIEAAQAQGQLIPFEQPKAEQQGLL